MAKVPLPFTPSNVATELMLVTIRSSSHVGIEVALAMSFAAQASGK